MAQAALRSFIGLTCFRNLADQKGWFMTSIHTPEQLDHFKSILRSARRGLVSSPNPGEFAALHTETVEAATLCKDSKVKTELCTVIAEYYHTIAEHDLVLLWLDKASMAADGNASAVAWVAYTRASIQMRNGQYQEALETVNSFNRAHLETNVRMAARFVMLHAGLLASLGHPDEAEGKYLKAIELYEQLESPSGMATAYYNYAELCLQLDNELTAHEMLVKAYEIESRMNNFSGLATTTGHLALLFAKRGETGECLQKYEESKLYAAMANIPMVIAVVKVNAIEIFETLRNFPAADACLADAQAYLEQHPFPVCEGALANAKGKMYARHGDFAAAEMYMHQALRISMEQKNKLNTGLSHLELGRLYSGTGKHDTAISHLNKAVNMLADAKAYIHTFLAVNALSSAYAATGDYKNAYEAASQWLVSFGRVFGERTIKRLRQMHARFTHQRENQADETHRLRNIELNEINNKLIAANSKLTELAAEKDDLIAIAAHDLRNPLADMNALLKTLIARYDSIDKDALVDELSELQLTVNRMGTIVHSFMELKPQGPYPAIGVTKMDLQMVSKNAVQRSRGRADRKGITIEHSVPAETVWAVGDPSVTDAVLDNLISNAIKYSPPHSTISVEVIAPVTVKASTFPDKGGKRLASVRVKDQGPGISKQEQPLLFTKYTQLSARPTAGEHSMGVGLYLSKRMAERMNATIIFEPEYSDGASFLFSLPVSLD